MGVRIDIGSILSQFTRNQAVVEVSGSTVGECLEQLAVLFPEMGKVLYAEDGRYLNYVYIYLNGEKAELLTEPVKDMDELQLFPVISGG